MDQNFFHDIVIAGGGVPGLTLAILLGQAGLSVAVIDPTTHDFSHEPTPSSHTTALMQSSLDVLEKTGALAHLGKVAGRMNAMQIIDMTGGVRPRRGQEGRITRNFDSLEIDARQFGLNIPSNMSVAALAGIASENEHINCLFGEKLADFKHDDHHVHVRCESGKEIHAKLLVAADGRHSATRAVAEIDTWQHDYEQDALTFLISHSKGHHHVSTEFHRPGGPLTFVPLRDANGEDHMSSIVWVENRKVAEDLLTLRRQELTQRLQDSSQGLLGEIQIKSEVKSRQLHFILAQQLAARRLVLMGEAAHALHPMGAQGLNLSLRDVETLVDLIKQHTRLGLDIGRDELTKEYERLRRIDITGRAAGTHSLVKLLNHDNPALHSVRRAGLKALTSLPPVKLTLMKAGMTGK